MTTLDLRGLVRDIPDFPKPGILFRDITPLMRSPLAWQEVMRQMGAVCDQLAPDLIVGIESRGFIVELADLGGKAKLPEAVPVESLIVY